MTAENETNPPTISACLIVRDEGAYRTRDVDSGEAAGVGSHVPSSPQTDTILDRCLSSLEGVADEIIVVDTGSKDNTKEVAAKYTDKIYDFEWCDDFSAARNFANSKATGDWILTIDADEYIPKENRPLYKQAVKAVDPPSPTCPPKLMGTRKLRRKRGNRVCRTGYVNHRKDPVFGLLVFAELLKSRPCLEFHFAGTHQDPMIEEAMRHYAEDLGVADRVFYYPWLDDVNEFLADKDYFLSSSLAEGFHLSLAEAMAAGLMPLIRSWEGAAELYPDEFIFKTAVEARKIVDTERPNPARYRDFIARNWPESRMLEELDAIISEA